ncbi:efflux RND transporter periplasmic adaptor subunit [Thioalkalivibrio sp. ALJ7]|uniref:efflux RND transporter periplasmic adaptor subunit n=1 Tax=Thioalkalivibrio sp. ALJ7 TaxID=1158756 RepID=UPI000373ED09|nr:efflux RND transporter periplasmic adaptor subunit [Thioalkalivibrio sp. ALJ7]
MQLETFYFPAQSIRRLPVLLLWVLPVPRRAGGLLLALALGLAGCGTEPSEAADPSAAEAATPIAALEVQPRDLSRELRLSARVEPMARVRLAARADGVVEAVHVEEGDRVEQGETLVELDVSEERAELARADAHAEEAQLEYARSSELRDEGISSRASYERARAALRSAESEQALWQARVDYGALAAGRDGVITERMVEPGEAVAARDALLELVDITTLVLRPGVSELDVRDLVVGQDVPIRLDAFPDADYVAEIRRIFPAASPDSQQVTVEIALPAEAADNGVRPGNLARIRMTVDERPNALAVPAAAIGEDDDARYVYVVVDEQLERRTVETGVTRGPWTEITEGLEQGEIVLATNPIDMREGQRVRIVGWRG